MVSLRKEDEDEVLFEVQSSGFSTNSLVFSQEEILLDDIQKQRSVNNNNTEMTKQSYSRQDDSSTSIRALQQPEDIMTRQWVPCVVTEPEQCEILGYDESNGDIKTNTESDVNSIEIPVAPFSESMVQLGTQPYTMDVTMQKTAMPAPNRLVDGKTHPPVFSQTPSVKGIIHAKNAVNATSHFSTEMVEKNTVPEYCVIALKGIVDQAQQAHLDAFIEGIILQGTDQIVCDLSETTMMSSSGWGYLIAQTQRLKKRGGNIVVAGVNGEVEQSFVILELDKLFLSFRTVSEAKMHFQSIATQTNNALFTTKQNAKEIEIHKMSLDDKIVKIISQDPHASSRNIHKILKSEEFGATKIGYGELFVKLRAMGLGSKDERYRYYRSL